MRCFRFGAQRAGEFEGEGQRLPINASHGQPTETISSANKARTREAGRAFQAARPDTAAEPRANPGSRQRATKA